MIEISLTKLKNNALFTLSLRVNELIQNKKTPEMGIDLYFERFVEAYTKYKAAMEKTVLSASELAQKDSVRDEMWVALRTHVKNYLRHPQLSGKAKSILGEIDKNGPSVYSQSYEAETAIIQSVSQILEDHYAEDMAEIHADVWFTLLKQAGAEFEDALRTFNVQKTEASEVDAASTVRPELEAALRNLFTFIPMQAEVSGETTLQDLSNELETEVSRF